MTRKHDALRGLFLAALLVLSVVAGAAAVGAVGAQDDNATGNQTGENATGGGADSAAAQNDDFYGGTEPMEARFRDGDANTVSTVEGGVLNFGVLYRAFNGTPWDANITATGLSTSQVESIVFDDSTEFGPNDLDRNNIIGTDFAGVPPGTYEFTVAPESGGPPVIGRTTPIARRTTPAARRTAKRR